jgi:hypothetical protein
MRIPLDLLVGPLHLDRASRGVEASMQAIKILGLFLSILLRGKLDCDASNMATTATEVKESWARLPS